MKFSFIKNPSLKKTLKFQISKEITKQFKEVKDLP